MRWLVLAAYALVAAVSQLLWLTFAPITTQAAAALHVDVGAAGDLAAVFPFVYILLALPTGRWLDARFEQALAVGAGLTMAGALVRLLAPSSFAVQMTGQLVTAAGQPLVLNAINKVAARHFPAGERATAISIGSVALFLGILVAVLSGDALYRAGGLGLLLLIQAALAVAAFAAVLLAVRVPPEFGGAAASGASLRLGWLLHDRFLWLLAALVFIGMGTYNGVATWLEAILDHFGEGAAAGGLIAVMTGAGIAGAAVIPPLAAARGRRRLVLLCALGVSAVAFGALTLRHDVAWSGAWLALDGVLLMASLPVVLDWAEVHAGAERQGEAVGFLMLAGNLGGLVLVVAVQVVLASAYLSLAVLAAAAVLGIPVALGLPGRAREGSNGPRGEGEAAAGSLPWHASVSPTDTGQASK